MDNDKKPENGQTTADAPDQTIITLVSRKPWQITIGGAVENMNVALAMLSETIREVETEWRIARGIAAQLKHKQDVQDTQRVNDLLNNLKFPKSH